MAARIEHRDAPITGSPKRRLRELMRLLAVNNFPLLNPGYRDLAEAAQTGQPLPENHPARRLPIL